MASRTIVLVALACAATVFAVTHFAPIPGGLVELRAATGGRPILDLQPSFAADEVYARLEAFGHAGRELYQRFLVTTDVVFPLSLLGFLVALAHHASIGMAPLRRGVLFALPGLWFALDMAENVSIYWLLSQYPDRDDVVASALGFVTSGKRAALIVALGAPLLTMAIARVRRWGR